MVSIFRDITERKRAEADRLALERRLQQTRKAESLARMAGAIAHHFNNQIAAIMGNIELALEDLPGGEPLRNRLNSAMAAADRAAEVSRLMLACRGQIAGKKEPRDLVKLCREWLPLARPSLPERVRLKTEMPPTGLVIRADAAQLGQVLTHLIENAAEAIGEGPGEIGIRVETIAAAAMERARVFPVDWQPRVPRLACLTVSDTGSGLDEAAVDQLFDPYFSTKFTGRGLGLAVALGTATGHGGAMAVESRPGRGSVFKVLLPLEAADGAAEPEDETGAGPAFQRGGMALLVEDQEPVRNVTEAMLERLGFSVVTARNGREAAAQFSEHRDRIRCVICDLTMPGMNGWETLRALRTISPDVPAILASGYDEALAMVGDCAGPAPAFLYKPYQKADLRDALGRVLKGQG
jgi:nitrogen-specific signal transduction histidine kinase/CheY-like chemotaxis protein